MDFKPFRDKMGLNQPWHGQPGPECLMLKDLKHPVTSVYIDDVSHLHLKVHVKKKTDHDTLINDHYAL